VKWHKNYKIVSFYTPDYEDYAAVLMASILKFLPSVQVLIAPIPQQKWSSATCQKAKFIRQMLDSNPGRGIAWIDVDAEVLGDVEFPEADWAVYQRPKGDSLRERFSPIRTGTVYFGPTKQGWDLARVWEEESRQQKDGIDQWALWRAWLRLGVGTVEWLPLRYCQKFDEPGEALIRHDMASRTHRRCK